MSFTNRIAQGLHDEHRATIALMERLEQLLTRYRRSPQGKDDVAVEQLLSDLTTGIEGEVERHFAFEEDRLFTYLDSMGDEAIGAHLTQEHAAIRPLGTQIVKLARQARDGGFDEVAWGEFRRVGQELSERLLAHVQKEEMALLPVLEEGMNAETEMALFEEYFQTA